MFGRRPIIPGTGQATATRGAWPVLLVLLAAALVPAGCVLWFMTAAMHNEELAMRQRLADAYRQQLVTVRDRLSEAWSQREQRLELATPLPGPQAFATLVRSGTVDAAVVFDADGRVVYPSPSPDPEIPAETPDALDEASTREQEGKYAEAAAAYTRIAEGLPIADHRARAYQAATRCLANAGDAPGAIRIVTEQLARPEYREARDESGRLIAPAALLFATKLSKSQGGDAWLPLRDALTHRLEDYAGPAMPSSQRRLLLWELAHLGIRSPMLTSEELAAASATSISPDRASPGLDPGPVAGTWVHWSSDHRVAALLRDSTLRSLVDLAASGLPGRVALYGPLDWPHAPEPLVSLPVGGPLADWRLAMYVDGPSPADAGRRVAMYLWTGAAGVTVIAVLTLAAGRYVSRQMTLTRLKNDLIATVTHELKTPLASTRVLVDTLLESPLGELPAQARDYLRLIARENERLSRLIDNFLTFSRMERNKRAFEMSSVAVSELVRAAAEAVADRFDTPAARLRIDVPDDLPRLRGDRDALVTAVLNLLDNAHKYTGDHKDVRLSATRSDGDVLICVEDNGIGLTRTAVRRVFDRFYQVDQTLSRKAGGCGLGLNIVKFIAEAHGGTISVESQPDRGSRFTLRLPAIASTNAKETPECQPAAAKPS